jgi:integrase
VALTMGLRQSEALGLCWEDVDLDLGYIRVTRQLQRIHGSPQLVEPKTERSRRTLAMPPMIAEALRHHHLRQQQERSDAGKHWVQQGLVFTTATGTPLDGTAERRSFIASWIGLGYPSGGFMISATRARRCSWCRGYHHAS